MRLVTFENFSWREIRTGVAASKQKSILEARERLRRRLAFLIMVFLLFLPLEGVLRKWVLNPIEQPLIFIRDPIMLLILMLYLVYKGGALPRWFTYWYGAVVLAMAIGLIQIATVSVPVQTILIGLRNYLFFIPLMFVMSDVLDAKDLRRLLLLCLWISLPSAVLVMLQFYSPVASPLNKGLTDDVQGRFLVVENIVRPYGLFTFVAAQATFCSLLFAIVLMCWSIYRRLKIPFWLLTAATTAVFIMGAHSGARTFFFSALGVFSCYVFGSLTSSHAATTMKQVVFSAAALAVFALVFIVVFPTSFESMSSRQTMAEAAEGSTFGRVFFIATEFLSVVDTTPFFGYGIGAGSNAGGFAASGTREFQLAEYEWTRVVLELGPVFGFLVIAARVLLAVWVGRLAFLAVRKRDNSMALIAFGFVVPLLVAVGQISGQNQMISFVWFSLGLTLSLSRLDLRNASTPQPAARLKRT